MRPEVYIPYSQARTPNMYILIRSASNPYGLLNPIRSHLHDMDPDVPVSYPRLMAEPVDQSVAGRRLLSVIMTLFAAAALFIAAAGLNGVVSYSASRRTHEIGIRIALGATRSDVLRMVTGGGARLIMIGAMLGAAGAFVASRAMRNMLYGISSLVCMRSSSSPLIQLPYQIFERRLEVGWQLASRASLLEDPDRHLVCRVVRRRDLLEARIGPKRLEIGDVQHSAKSFNDGPLSTPQ